MRQLAGGKGVCHRTFQIMFWSLSSRSSRAADVCQRNAKQVAGRDSKLVDELRRCHVGHQSTASSSVRIRRYKAEQIVYVRSIRARDAARIADGLYDDTRCRGRSDSRQRHRLVGSAIECDGPEDPPCARTIGNASHLAPGLPGRAGDKLQGQALGAAVWRAFESNRDLQIFEELFPLPHRKTKD
jgi:hypothetical protein